MQVGFFLLKQIDRALAGLAVDALIGDGIEPFSGGGIEGVEVRDIEAGEEIFFT
jgi:hypothetical protein